MMEIEKKEAFQIIGFHEVMPINLKRNDEPESAWKIFMKNYNPILVENDAYKEPMYQIGRYHQISNTEVEMAIGAEYTGIDIEGMSIVNIDSYTYAVFSITGPTNSHLLAETLEMVNDEWLPASGYHYAANFYMDSYGPGDPKADDYVFDLWIPIER